MNLLIKSFPDEVLRVAKSISARDGIKLRDFVIQAVHGKCASEILVDPPKPVSQSTNSTTGHSTQWSDLTYGAPWKVPSGDDYWEGRFVTKYGRHSEGPAELAKFIMEQKEPGGGEKS